MRRVALITTALLACASCARKESAASSSSDDTRTPAVRRSGLWIQMVMRDGRPQALGRFKVCVDPATDARLTVIGSAAGKARCERKSTRQPDGSLAFHSRCALGRHGTIETTGTVWSDFGASYRLHADSIISDSPFDALNGRHATDVSARYVGPCPSNMAPGDMILGPGLKVNLSRVPLGVLGS